MLRVYYRYCPENVKRETRPQWFSKELCLKSFTLSMLNYKKEEDNFVIRIIVDNREKVTKKSKIMILKYAKLLKAKIIRLNFKSNTRSYQYVLDLALRESNLEDICFLVEDDYLFIENAVKVLYEAYLNLCPDYLTPYDHPVRYDYNFSLGSDLPHWENRIFLSSNYHFRSQESTCMTFMTSAKILIEDKEIHKYFSSLNRKCPNDRELFRSLQNLNHLNDSRPKRLLLGPIPSIATHSHKDYLAPCINWDKIARDILSKEF